MINFKIGANERRFNSLNEIDENWINQQINGLRKDGYPACVRISINEGPVNLTLTTADCPPSGGGGRQPTSIEAKVFDLWNELGLNGDDFQGGKFVAFLKRVRNVIN